MSALTPAGPSLVDGRPAPSATGPAARPGVGPGVEADAKATQAPAWAAISLAAGLSLLAAAMHLVVTPEHLREWWVFGAFFIAVSVGQLALALLLARRPHPWTLLAGVWGNVAVIGVYLASRTIGLPWGPPEHGHGDGPAPEHLPVAGGVGNGTPIMPGTAAESGHLETVGALDFSALGAELLLVVVLVSLMPARHRRVTLNALAALGALAWGLRISALGS